MTATELTSPRPKVCVWFGEHKIVEPAFAARFKETMRRRFVSLRVTNQPATARILAAGDEPVGLGGAVGAPEPRLQPLAGRGVSGDDEYSRPLLLGYMRRELFVTDGQVETVKRELVSFAETEGFCMGCTYVEPTGTWPTAFGALIEAVNRYEVTAVVLPSLLHFAALGPPTGIRDSFEQATGARVLIAQPPP